MKKSADESNAVEEETVGEFVDLGFDAGGGFRALGLRTLPGQEAGAATPIG